MPEVVTTFCLFILLLILRLSVKMSNQQPPEIRGISDCCFGKSSCKRQNETEAPSDVSHDFWSSNEPLKPDLSYVGTADQEAFLSHNISSPVAEHEGKDEDGSDWEDVEGLWAAASGHGQDATIEDRIRRVGTDEQDLQNFWIVKSSPNRYRALSKFYTGELESLQSTSFDAYDQEGRVDYLLLRNYLDRSHRQLKLEHKRDQDADVLLPFSPSLITLIEARQECDFDALGPKRIADAFHNATASVLDTKSRVESGKLHVSREPAYRAMKTIATLRSDLAKTYAFFQGYNPMFDWWVKAPYNTLEQALQSLEPTIGIRLAGIRTDDKDEIIGEPIGRDGLLIELEANMIPYTPEELLKIAHEKYVWCESEMKKAASELGFGDDWKAALRHVQNIYVDPGQQPILVKSLIDAAGEYVKKHGLVTVPPLAEKTWRMFMMSPAAQKVNPFFLGGPSIIVSYPTADMAHVDKLMSMRGNGPHLSKATAFHEMIPGHHLQLFVGERSRSYRWLFNTPFYIEGWAMYWELIFWDRGDFFTSPEDRIGTLFWRMHRCARIMFSLKFHLGQMSPQQCVDLLVDMVGHERATAEGEVRRSLNGQYEPLYQAAYFLGALQLYALRKEVLSTGLLSEKGFNDRVLKANQMPIELLRALILNEPLKKDYKSKWRFDGDHLGTLSTLVMSRSRQVNKWKQ